MAKNNVNTTGTEEAVVMNIENTEVVTTGTEEEVVVDVENTEVAAETNKALLVLGEYPDLKEVFESEDGFVFIDEGHAIAYGKKYKTVTR